MEKIEIDKMETKTTYLEDSMIGGLIGQLVQLDESDITASEQYQCLRRAIDGRRILNLNGVFRSYTQADRSRALTLAFRLVNNSSITSLLLEDNGIDAASLVASLQNASAVESSSQLSNIRILDLANNSIRKGSGKAEKLSPHARRFSSLRKLRRVVFHSASKDEGLSTLADAIKTGCLRSLEHFNLSGSPEIASKYLVSLPDSITKCHATDLKKLLLRKAGLDDDAVLKLAEAISLGKLAAIEKLDITGNRELTNKSMVLLTTSFQTRHTIHLRKLLLGETDLQDDAVAKLAEAVSSGMLPALEKLDLSGSSWTLTNKSMPLLITSFQTGHTLHLKKLLLGKTRLQDDAVAKLAKAISLGMLPALEKLDLSRNEGLTNKSGVLLTTSFQTGHTIHLKELVLGSTRLQDSAVAKLSEAISSGMLPALEKLDLSRNEGLTNKSIALLTTSFQTGHTIHLRELVLGNTCLQDSAVAKLAEALSLGKLPALEKLDLSRNEGLTNKSGVLLTTSFQTGHTIHLKELVLDSTGLQDSAVAKLSEAISSGMLPALEKLDLSGSSWTLTNKSMPLLITSFQTEHAIHLRELVLGNTCLQDSAVAKLAEALSLGKLPALEKLDLSRNEGLTNKSGVLLTTSFQTGHTIHLKELLLGETDLQDDAVAKLAEAVSSGMLPALEKLDLSRNEGLTNKSIALLTTSFQTGHTIHLRELVLGNTCLQDSAVAKLAEALSLGKLPALEKLDLSRNEGLTNKSGVLLTTSFQTGHTIHLKELVLGSTRLQDSAVAKLAEAISSGMLPALEKLDLSGTYWGLTEESVGMLTTSFQAGHTVHLTELLLRGTALHDDVVAKLAETISLGKLPALEKLDLSGEWTGKKSMVPVTTSFQTGYATHLRKLRLENQAFQDDAAAQLAKAISLGKLPALEKLDISSDALTSRGDDRGMLLLMTSFKTGNTSHLRHLRFKRTGIKDDAIIELAKAISLGKLPALEEVSLHGNREVTDESMVQLRASFPMGKVGNFSVPFFYRVRRRTFRDEDLIPRTRRDPRMVGKETLKHHAKRQSHLELDSGLKEGSPVSKFAQQSKSMLEGQTEFFSCLAEDLFGIGREESGDIQDKELQEPMLR